MYNCTFCKIVARKIPGYIIAETDNIIVFQSLENHPLIVPKEHIPDIYSLDTLTGNLIMEQLILVAKAVKQSLKCDGVYITQANEAAAGQDVFHIHFHIYPRWENQVVDGLAKVEAEEREKTANKIKQALS